MTGTDWTLTTTVSVRVAAMTTPLADGPDWPAVELEVDGLPQNRKEGTDHDQLRPVGPPCRWAVVRRLVEGGAIGSHGRRRP
jgi:hypothetical protein